jgi:hypothetical protein
MERGRSGQENSHVHLMLVTRWLKNPLPMKSLTPQTPSLFSCSSPTVSVSGVPVPVLDETYVKASRSVIDDIELYCSLVRMTVLLLHILICTTHSRQPSLLPSHPLDKCAAHETVFFL